jgi:alpha-tubulin suppressor-like RCC1 family protein
MKQTTPVEVVDQSFFTLAGGPDWSCGMTTSGGAYCWGDNSFGELGIGMATPGTARYHTRPEKVKVTGLVP